jgi:hypothetical protein
MVLYSEKVPQNSPLPPPFLSQEYDGRFLCDHFYFLLLLMELCVQMSQVCDLSVSDNVVEIIFHVFDTNRDGNLTYDELLRVLYKRERDITQPVEEGVPGLLSCCRNCSSNFSFSRFLS